MEKSKKSFVMYGSWSSAIEKMSNEQAGQLLKAIYALQDDENAEPEDPSVRFVFEIIKDKLFEDAREWEKAKQRRSESGKKGMEKRWSEDKRTITNDNAVITPITNDNTVTESITPITVSVSGSVSVSDSVSVNESPSETKREKQAKEKRKRFSAPSVDEVRNYCRERGNSIDAETFVDFYASKGWKVGNSPMKDWQSAIRTWEKRECRASPREKPVSFNANDYLQGIIQGGA
ncbi:MAG: hypothetical protein HXK89_02505 [Lachnospiraceae bacterium]|nr:hypothetical protein [Lachnospiraceae bacterium]